MGMRQTLGASRSGDASSRLSQTGWLWKKTSEGWVKRWCTANAKCILLFQDREDVNALEAILLPQATLNEIIVTSRGPQPAPYSRGLGLTREPSSGPDSPRAVADLGGSSLNLERRHAQGAHDLLLAADSQATHVAWLEYLSKHCSLTNKISSPASRATALAPTPTVDSVAHPPAPALRWACSPRHGYGSELRSRLREARLLLEDSIRALDVPPHRPVHAVHAALAELHACLLGMARVLEEETFDHEDSGGETESEGSGKPAADVDAAHAWLHGAADIIGEYSSAAEQLLNRDPPACVFMPWRPLASDATALLGALEEVLRREASQQKRAMQSALGAEDSPGRTVVRFRRSAMPYRTYWAGKPAL